MNDGMRQSEKFLYPAPDEAICLALWKQYHTPEPVMAHCQRVAEEARKLGEELNGSRCSLDLKLITGAALVHDLMKGQKNHGEEAAKVLEEEGYMEIADVVRQHHELREEKIDEAAVVYLADKWIRGVDKISLEERFALSLTKCRNSVQAMEAHDRRQHQAEQVETLILKQIGRRRNEAY